MTNELVLNASSYGIEELKAKELLGNLPHIIEERKPLENQFSDVIKMDIELPETWVMAKNLRLLVQKNRTQGILVWHKTSKDFFLKGGQFVDAIKRKEIVINERMESDLKQIEQHEQIIEAEKLKKLREQRNAILEKYDINPGVGDPALMSEEVWKHYINSVKLDHQSKIDAEKKEEAERIEEERIDNLGRKRQTELYKYIQFQDDKINPVLELGNMSDTDYISLTSKLKIKKVEYEKEQKRIKAENDRLKKEAELKRIADVKAEKERQRLVKIEQEKRDKLERERLAKAEAERKEREKKEAKERAEYEAKLKKEREEKERIRKELEAKVESERKRKESEQLELIRIQKEKKDKEEDQRLLALAPIKGGLMKQK